MRRSRILVLNQYYRPGVEATANLLADLCQSLAVDHEVTVVTGRLLGMELPDEEMLDGVRVIRVRSTAFDRSAFHLRASNYLTYLARTLTTSLRLERPDLVLCMTDPPVVGDLAILVARRFRAPLLVVSEDVFPEIATELGRLRNPLLVGLLRRLVGYYVRRADTLVAIGERMRERLVDKGAAPERVHVIPNWVDTSFVVPGTHDNEWARQNGLVDRFVVMHSGNVGHAQNLDVLVLATTYLRDLEDLAVPIIGFGARHDEIRRLAERLDADAVRFLDYQSRSTLPLSLASADLHYVGLARGLSGFVVPSRLYPILAAGRPVLVAAEDDSETARVVRDAGCGIHVPPDRPDLVAAAIRDARDGVHDLAEMGRRGRAYVEREADRGVALGRYRSLVRALIDR